MLPIRSWGPAVSRHTIKADFLAGCRGAIVALPQGAAFAALAGMPPQYGLYTGIVPAIIAALFGASWLLVSGPTTAASLVLFSSLSQHALPGAPEYVQLALTVTFMVGLIQLSMGLVRFGSLVNFISHSVVVGFTAGAAVLIVASQLKHFLGLGFESGQGHIQSTLYNLFLNLSQINTYAVVVGVITIAVGIGVRLYRPSLPSMIIAMITGGLAAFALSETIGKEVVNIAVVGAMPATLPPLSMPSINLTNIKILVPAALAMALFALVEAISIARSLADKTGQDFDGNQEFIGQGLSNMVGSFFSSYVATGSFNRTSHPHIMPRVPDPDTSTRSFTTNPVLPECPQLKIVRIDGSLYFGAVHHVKSSLRELIDEDSDQKNLLIVGSGINFIDMAGADLLSHLARERRAAGGALYFYDMKEDICSHFKFLNYLLDIGLDNIFASKKEAIGQIFDRLDPEICRHCTARIFLECNTVVSGAEDENTDLWSDRCRLHGGPVSQ